MTSLYQILMMILQIAQFLILAQVIMSWLVNFQVLNIRQPLVAQAWDALNRLLQPVYRQLRRFVPTVSGIDFSPVLLLIAIFFLERLVATQL